MIKRFYVLATLLSISYFASGQPKYEFATLPKELLPYAASVVRNSETIVEIKDKDDVAYHYKIAITVINRNGAEEARLVIPHNKSMKIRSIKGAIYDEFGKQISKIAERDFIDQSYSDGVSLFEDMRYKYFNPPVSTYPYTVEYEYDLNYNQCLNIEPWIPVGGSEEAVEQSRYTLICKPDFKIVYKENNYPGTAEKLTDKSGNTSYSWKLSNVKAFRSEPYSPHPYTFIPNVHLAPQSFSYEGYTGSYNNWNDLGKWIYDKLLNGRAELPSQTVEQIKSLTQNITDPKEKARRIYEYMQQKTRYISIQIGIGGYQPFLASEVDRLGYGDCKGLVNYTKALLKVADIDAYYCIVKAGSNKRSLMSDFASMDQANHVILCIPFKNDTTWLECTSKSIPFGYLGDFTDDRWVLACTPEGGKLLHTPRYTAEENKEDQRADFTLLENGELSGNMLTTFSGTQYENREYLMQDSYEDQLKKIRKHYPVNNMDIETFKLNAVKTTKPVLTETLKFKAPEYGSTENGRLYFMVNSVNRMGAPREVRNRFSPLYINRGYTDEDKITYKLPAGYHPVKQLLHVNLSKKFGNYTAMITITGDQLVYTRKLQVFDGTYTKEDYNDFVEFLDNVQDADNYTMALTKNN